MQEEGAMMRLRQVFTTPDGTSPWPKRLLIGGAIALLVGLVWMMQVLPDLDEQMRPDKHYTGQLDPFESKTINVTGMHIIAAYQNVTDAGTIDGDFSANYGEQSLEIKSPSVFTGVARLSFNDNTIFEPMGYIQPAQNGQVTFTSNSNNTIWLVDQNEVSETALSDTYLAAACTLSVIGACLIPSTSLVLLFRSRNKPEQSTVVRLQMADGREIQLAVDNPPPEGPILTTDQLYAMTQLEQQFGHRIDRPEFRSSQPAEELSTPLKETIPPPFADRPDSREQRSEREPVNKPVKKSGEDAPQESWKKWDEG